MKTMGHFSTTCSRNRKISALRYRFSLKAMAFAACLASASSVFAQQPLAGSYTNIDPPGSALAGAFGINNDGVIVGRYKTTLTGFYHGFLRDESGSYNTIDPPNAIYTEAHGVNNNGAVVGYFCDTAPCGSVSTYQGFLLKDGVHSSFGSPQHINTWAIRINDRGQIVGCDHDTDTMGSMHGFLDSGGTFTDLTVPASMNNGISPNGKTIAGFYTDMITSTSHGYILSRGKFMPFDVPGSTQTSPWDLNAKGQIVGAYTDGAGHLHGFLRNAAGVFFSIDYPEATGTWAFGLNEAGQVVGQYLDTSGTRHAYLLTRNEEN